MAMADATESIEKPERPISGPTVTELAVSGMTCGNCARHVMEAIQAAPGVASATVSLEAQQASVRWKPGATPDVGAVVEAVRKAGYGARGVEAHTRERGESKLAGGRRDLSCRRPASAAPRVAADS